MPKIKRKKRHLAESKKASLEKYAPVVAAYFTTVKATATTTPSGLTYKIVQKEQVSNQLMVVLLFSLCGLF
jgi:hypothetical protein